MFRKAKRPKTQSTISSFFRIRNSVAENGGQNNSGHLEGNEKFDDLKEKQAEIAPSLLLNNLDTEQQSRNDTSISDHPKYRKNEINKGPHQPLDLEFPANNGRKFQKNWYNQFPWLEYYAEVNRAFCFPCRLFKNENLGCSEKTYTEIGFQNWKKGVEKFKTHESSEAHKSATERFKSYESSLRKGSVAVQVISQRASEIEENKKYLKLVCESLLFCARQGIALRGHDETENSGNRGTFLELMNLRSNDNALIKKFFSDKGKYFSYISKEIQNEILELMSKQACETIASEAIQSDCYSILVDETADIAHDEQVAVVIRYINPKNFRVHERFLGFFRIANTEGETLAILIKNVLEQFGLPLSKVRAQCYDGAANMRGSYKGVAARILEENPLAFYVHCYAHILNLCIVDACSKQVQIRNSLGILKELHNFFSASTKRTSLFKENLKNKSFAGGNQSLKSLSDTRWNCRIEACNTVLQNFDEITSTLQAISESDPKNGSQAEALLNNIESFQFIFCLILIQRILKITDKLSKSLQSDTISFSAVNELVSVTKECLNEFRNEDFFEKLWLYVNDICVAKSFPSPTLPRCRKVSSKIGGGFFSTAQNVKSFYRTEITFPVIDIALNAIDERFKENELDIFQSLKDVTCSDPSTTVKNTSILKVCNTYDIDIEEIKGEIKIFHKMYRRYVDTLPATHTETTELKKRCNFLIERELRDIFPHLTKLIQILLVIPVSTASCERSFSCLRALKSYLRNSMCQERLSALAILKIENSIDIDFVRIIEQFSENKNRRLLFF